MIMPVVLMDAVLTVVDIDEIILFPLDTLQSQTYNILNKTTEVMDVTHLLQKIRF